MMKENMRTGSNWEEEYKFDPDAAERIVRVVNSYPMTLSDCASILEAVTPLTSLMPADDLIRYLKSISTISNAMKS